jgi:YihY family inner membrane protein
MGVAVRRSGESRGPVPRVLSRLDRAQRARPVLGVPFAVVKKHGDDHAGKLAALIAYYAFFSLFPLLLLFVTVLGFALRSHPALQDRLVRSVVAQFPVLGDQIRANVHSLRGSLLALVVGAGGALWAGIGVTLAVEDALNDLWAVAPGSRPGFWRARARGLLVLVVLGGACIIATGLAGVAASDRGHGVPEKTLELLSSAALDFAIFLLCFRLLISTSPPWRSLVPGALTAAVSWVVLQAGGALYVTRTLRHASATYGAFAAVIGLLTWLYVGATVTLLAAQVNVVCAGRLWPRSLVGSPTHADLRVASRFQGTTVGRARPAS